MDRLKKWWVLLGEEGIGPVKLKDRVETLGSLDRAWEWTKSREANFSTKQANRLLSLRDSLSNPSHWGLSWEDVAYPIRWRELRDAPIVVFGRGDQQIFNRRSFLAIVGTRDCTQRAAELGFELGRNLAQQDWGIVSGLSLIHI